MVREKRSPLDVMLRNMWFWDEAAQDLEQRLKSHFEDMVNSGEVPDEDTLERLKELLKNSTTARENAQRCAVDAAPYVHAKFQSVVFKDATKDDNKTHEVVLELPKPAGESNEARSYRDNWSTAAAVAVAINENEEADG